jgi:hypothetical protein
MQDGRGNKCQLEGFRSEENTVNEAAFIILGLYQDVEVRMPSEAMGLAVCWLVVDDSGRGGSPIIAPSITRAEVESLKAAAIFRALRGETAFKSK